MHLFYVATPIISLHIIYTISLLSAQYSLATPPQLSLQCTAASNAVQHPRLLPLLPRLLHRICSIPLFEPSQVKGDVHYSPP